MKILTIVFALITTMSFSALAGEQVKLGIVGNVGADGFFSSTVSSFKIEKVTPNSPAEKAGLLAGQKVIAIDGCEIPGCPVDQAKKLIRKESGETLTLLLENEDGTQTLVKVAMDAWED